MPANTELERPTPEKARSPETAEKNGKAQTAMTSQPEKDMSVEPTGKQEATVPEGVERTRAGRIFLPAVDIYETRDSVELVADMPGVDESSVDVTLEKNVLTIYGRVEPVYPAGYTPLYSEYRVGDYQRSFTISNDIDWERISGKVKDGVLRLTLPKAGPAKAKKISITSA